MKEQGKFEVYKKKLQGVCDENNLVYRFRKDNYPIGLTIRSDGSVDGQMSMVDKAEEDGFRSPDASLVFYYKDGDLMHRIVGKFTIGDALFSKLKNIFKKMHDLWLQYFFRDVIERGLLTSVNMPAIDDDSNGGDIIDGTFDDVSAQMESLSDDEYDYDDE